MRRMPFKSLLAVALGLVAALPSCETNDSLMFVVGVYARRQGQCAPKPEADSPILAQGTLDRTFASEYYAALLIGNQITERGSREQVRTETSRVSLKGAEVQLENVSGAVLQLTNAAGQAVPNPFTTTATGFVDAASGTDPALTIMYATLIPGSISSSMPKGISVAKVRVFGETLGGEEVESSELSFPIEVCDGCLISYPASARDLTADGSDYVCKTATDTSSEAGSSEIDLPCELGVDVAAPCTVCSGVYAVCQSPANNCSYNPGAMTPDGEDCPP